MSRKVSENFWRHEFACQCGCGFATVDVELPQLCEDVREFDGGNPKTPNSGCRCKHRNSQTPGAAPNSLHTEGRAADLPCDSPEIVFDKLCEKYPDRYGFILYHDRVHVDTRETPYRERKI